MKRFLLGTFCLWTILAVGCSGNPQAGLPVDAGNIPTDAPDRRIDGDPDDPVIRTGVLAQDEIWRGGTILVTRELIVPEGRTLTIEAGTRVQFTTGVEPTSKIVVNGALYAQGDFQDFVFFVAETDSSDWNGIFYANNSVGRLSYAFFQQNTRVNVRSSPVQLSFCQFLESLRGAAVTVAESSPLIEDCLFRSNVAGVQCLEQSSPEILNNTFIGNVYGIVCDNGAQPTVARNIIANNREYGVYSRGASSPEIQNNNIVRNGKHAVRDGGRLFDNFIQGNNGLPPTVVEMSLSPQSNQVFGVEEVVSARSSSVSEAGERRLLR
ncbi:MAG: right-handed parallel beta-helix repeat-containing protein [Candidatus Poribacteria bacterium]|nr:right-handed parallel beta-helix repeat-containing protein [Candidatus Poribacteria bacterium]